MIKRIFLLCLLMILTGCVSWLVPKVATELAELKAGQYKLDRAHAALLFKVEHIGLSTYVGRFNDFNASLDFDPEDIAATKLHGIIEIASLDINNPVLTEDLLSRTWFDVENFPQAVFTTLSVEPIGDREFEFKGSLNWRGVTKTVSLIGTFNGGASNVLTGKYTLGFEARGSILRSDFGMDAYTPLVADNIDIEIYAEFQR